MFAQLLFSGLALGIIAENVTMILFGKDARAFPSALATTPWMILGAGVYPHELLVPVVGIALMVAVELGFRRTLAGKALLAVAFSHEAAGLMGIDVNRTITAAYALSSLLAGVAGVLLAPLLNVSATMGTTIGLKAFAVAIIGGMESPRGIIVAGFLYGIFEAIVAGYLGTGVREILGFGLVIVVLLLRPWLLDWAARGHRAGRCGGRGAGAGLPARERALPGDGDHRVRHHRGARPHRVGRAHQGLRRHREHPAAAARSARADVAALLLRGRADRRREPAARPQPGALGVGPRARGRPRQRDRRRGGRAQSLLGAYRRLHPVGGLRRSRWVPLRASRRLRQSRLVHDADVDPLPAHRAVRRPRTRDGAARRIDGPHRAA